MTGRALPERRLWVGCYTPDQGADEGVSVRPVVGSVVGPRERTVPLPNPSWVLPHPSGRSVLAVLEEDPGSLVGIPVDPARPPSAVSTGEAGPCHATVSPDGRLALVAHYGSGHLVSVGLDSDGMPVEVTGDLRLCGPCVVPGPVPDRQDASHPHQVVLDGDLAFVPDLGCDLIHRVKVRADGSLDDLLEPIALPPGFGPRHLVAVGDLAVVVGELANAVAVGRHDPDHRGEWVGVGLVPTLLTPLTERTSSDPEVGNLASAIRVADDGHVLVGNRGADTVTVLRLDPRSGELTAVRELPTGGTWPRDLLPDGDLVWVANERSHEVTALRWRGEGTGEIVARVATPSPTSLALT